MRPALHDRIYGGASQISVVAPPPWTLWLQSFSPISVLRAGTRGGGQEKCQQQTEKSQEELRDLCALFHPVSRALLYRADYTGSLLAQTVCGLITRPLPTFRTSSLLL